MNNTRSSFKNASLLLSFPRKQEFTACFSAASCFRGNDAARSILFKTASKQRGAAIIVALFLVGLVAMIALTMMDRLQRDLRRTQLLLRSTQAGLYAQGSVIWALDTLRSDWLNQKKGEVVDRLPLESPVNTLNSFHISSTIEDAQGLFNLNNLTTDAWAACFQRLLLILDPQLSAETAQNITRSTGNWIAPASQDPNEDLYYTRLPQPYRSPHRPMASVSEFRLVKGVTPQLYQRVRPYITALPENNTLINVNTAAAPLLQSLSSALTAASAQSIVVYRKQLPFVSLDQFLNIDVVRNNTVPSTLVTVSSQYFLIKTRVEHQELQLLLTTLAGRLTQTNKVLLQVLWQSKGGI